MKTHTNGNGRGLDDLYILPDNSAERDRIEQYLKSRNIGYQWSYSDVDGQDWYGKHFLEIPFGSGYLGVITQVVSAHRFRCTFTGRRVGAIGITYPATVDVDAINEEEARAACYAAGWEHISNFAAVRV